MFCLVARSKRVGSGLSDGKEEALVSLARPNPLAFDRAQISTKIETSRPNEEPVCRLMLVTIFLRQSKKSKAKNNETVQ